MKKVSTLVTFMVLFLFLASGVGSCIAPSDNLIEIAGPNNIKIKAAVTVPPGDGPFPAIIMVHGSSGFTAEFPLSSYLSVAKRFTADGFIVALVSYNAGSKKGESPAAQKQILDAIDVMLAQPNVKPGKVGLWGISAGAATVLNVAAASDRVFAVASLEPWLPNAAGTENKIQVPVLLFGGDFDTICPVSMIKAYESALKTQGKTVESMYGPWMHSFEYYPMTKRAAEFFVKYAPASVEK